MNRQVQSRNKVKGGSVLVIIQGKEMRYFWTKTQNNGTGNYASF